MQAAPATRPQLVLAIAGVVLELPVMAALVLVLGAYGVALLPVAAAMAAIPLVRHRARRLRVLAGILGALFVAGGAVVLFVGGAFAWPGALLLLAAAATPTVGYRRRRSPGAAVGTIAAWTLSALAVGLMFSFLAG